MNVRSTLFIAVTAPLIACFTILAFSGVRADGQKPKPGESKAIEAEFTSGVLKLAGQKIVLPCEPATLEKLLGKPSRVESGGANTAIVWDDAGIRALQNPKTKKVSEITFRVGPGRLDNITKQKFTGKLVIDGVTIGANSDIAEAAKSKKGAKIEQSTNRGYYWSIKKKGASPEVTIETEDDSGKGVREVSFSKS